jgi:glucan-binding YG repeat protein
MLELWKDIDGFKGFYKISNLGKVKSLSRQITVKRNGSIHKRKLKGKMMHLKESDKGYMVIGLRKPREKRKWFMVHRIVADSFISKYHKNLDVNHKDGIKTNNNSNNLEWVTSSENQIHAFKTGLQIPSRGENNGASKLKRKQVENIIKMFDNGETNAQVLKTYNISAAQVSRIKSGSRWAHLERPYLSKGGGC